VVVVRSGADDGDGAIIEFGVVTVKMTPGGVVTVKMTPGDSVGSVTERLLYVWADACTVDACGVTEAAAGVGVVAELTTETLLTLLIPRILLAVKVLKQPTYTPDVLLSGTAKQESPAPQDVSLNVPVESQFPVEPLTQAMEPGAQLDDVVSDEKSKL
jgi:hypothetical protein